MIFAITGGTGFVGSHLIDAALAAGHEVRALARRPQPARKGVTWVAGALDDRLALDTLVAGADAAVHVAGAVNAPDRDGFAAANVAGTDAMIDAARAAQVRRFVHVSSLAAREPQLSDYGWSKAEAERLVEASALDWTIVRPPAVFGPRDTEFADVFRVARRGLVVMPPNGDVSIIAVEDLADFLLLIATRPGAGECWEPDDGRDWTYRGFGAAIAAATGGRARVVTVPGPLLALGARFDRLWRGERAKLTSDRVAYLRHPDWRSHRRPPAELWHARRDTAQALADTARWYRAQARL